MSDEYWSIDVPDLTETQAAQIKDRLGAEFDVHPIDPGKFMVRAFDRRSVEFLAGRLRETVNSGMLDPIDAHGAGALLEDCEEWLLRATATDSAGFQSSGDRNAALSPRSRRTKEARRG